MVIAPSQTLSAVQVRLQSILETAFDAYVSMDGEGRIIDWNRQAEVTFGFSRDEVVGRMLAETIIPPRYREAHWSGLSHFLSTGEGPVLNRRLHVEALHRDGHEFPVELTIWLLRDADLWTFHAFVRDVTELREAQRRALESERQAAVAEIISVLAQDSSNALQQIQMGSELLAMEFPENAKALEHIGLIQKARERLESLFKDVHGYTIPLKLKRRVCNLAEIWEEAWAQLASCRKDKNAELVPRAANTDLHCTVDRTGMEQVFRIVLQNSLTRCPDPARIEIDGCDDSLENCPAVRVTIRDNGPALPREQWQQTFGIVDFNRLHEPTAELAIAARIVDAHGGRMTASGRFHRAAEFLITLPRGT